MMLPSIERKLNSTIIKHFIVDSIRRLTEGVHQERIDTFVTLSKKGLPIGNPLGQIGAGW